MQKAVVKLSAIDEHKDTIIDTVRRNQSDNKHLKDVAEKSYFKYLLGECLGEITTDQNLMNDVLERVKQKMILNDNEAFNLRIVKLIKPELEQMFKEDIGGIMAKKKVVMDNYFPEDKTEASHSDDSDDDEE